MKKHILIRVYAAAAGLDWYDPSHGVEVQYDPGYGVHAPARSLHKHSPDIIYIKLSKYKKPSIANK
jgi:hypothetical protein